MEEYSINIGGRTLKVEVLEVSGGKASVKVDGNLYEAEYSAPQPAGTAKPENTPQTAGTIRPENAPQAAAKSESSPAPQPSKAAGPSAITAPIPGVVVELCVSKGDSVKAGQKAAVLEAMKMENEILAPADGTVTEVLVAEGDSVMEGDKLIEIG